MDYNIYYKKEDISKDELYHNKENVSQNERAKVEIIE